MDRVMKQFFAKMLGVSILLCGLTAPLAPAETPTADLRITNVYLGFGNMQPRQTVQRRQNGLQAFADITYTGAGMIEGCWIVDGQVFADIAQYVTGVGRVRIESPGIPGLPTILEGLHIVGLVIKNPVQPFKPVRLSYFVTTGKKTGDPLISLSNPPDSAVIDPAGQLFSWESDASIATYLIEFIDDNPARPVASAFTENRHYKVPIPVVKYKFIPGRTYFWRIKGFSARHEWVSESLPRQFQMTGGHATETE
jgi:hypothetical protein